MPPQVAPAAVDFTFARRLVAHCYGNNGHVSADPAMQRRRALRLVGAEGRGVSEGARVGDAGDGVLGGLNTTDHAVFLYGGASDLQTDAVRLDLIHFEVECIVFLGRFR